MKLDNKTLIIFSTFAFIFVLVLLNLELFTGQAWKYSSRTYDEPDVLTSVQVNPNTISPGEYITIEIIPGTGCADKRIEIYKEDRKYLLLSFQKDQITRGGGYRICDPAIISYKSWSSWKEGAYYVLVKDIKSNTYVKAPFFIE